MTIGYQLSSITPYLQTEKDLQESFKKIAALGYKDVQLQGVPADIPFTAIADALNAAGLKCIAVQEDFPDGFGKEPEKYIERAKICGAQYLTFALIPFDIDTIEKLEAFAAIIRDIYKKVTAAGLIFAFHPIGPDFRLLDGTPVYERFMGMMPDDMQLTFCVHSTFGTPVHYTEVLDKFAGRMDLVHFKDSILLPDGKPQLTPLGAGRTDWQPVAEACVKAGAKWVFAEQERWEKDAFECAADSLAYLNSLKF